MLIDTGATISVMTPSFLRKLPDQMHRQLKATNVEVLTADNKRMEIMGTVSAMVGLGFGRVEHKFYVGMVDTDVLLGLDFLDKQGCQLDLANNTLAWGSVCVPLHNSRNCRRLLKLQLKEQLLWSLMVK